jgi:hypothetical protein
MAAAAEKLDGAAITLWVKKEGDASWAEVTVDSTMSVARMTKKIVKELPSLQGKDLSTLILNVAKGKAGKAVGEPLDSRTTVAAAGLENGASIVIKAAGSAGKQKLVDTARVNLQTLRESGLTDRTRIATTLPGVCSFPTSCCNYPHPPRFTSCLCALSSCHLAFDRAAILRSDATSAEVDAELSPIARKTIADARAQRKLLQGVPILMSLRAGMSVGEAKRCGVTLPPDITDDKADMTVGIFELPALDSSIILAPKSECRGGSQFLQSRHQRVRGSLLASGCQ